METNPVLEIPYEDVLSTLSMGGHVYVGYAEYCVWFIASEFLPSNNICRKLVPTRSCNPATLENPDLRLYELSDVSPNYGGFVFRKDNPIVEELKLPVMIAQVSY